MVPIRGAADMRSTRVAASAASGFQVSERPAPFPKGLSVGAELYHHSRDADEGRSLTGINFGALYRFTPHWSLIGSMGPGVQNASRAGSYDFYAALKADY